MSSLTDALDDPVRASLLGPQAHLARAVGTARVHLPDVTTFVSVPPEATRADWADLTELLGPGGFADLFSAPVDPPAGWARVFDVTGWQLVGPDIAADTVANTDGARPVATDEVIELGPSDVPEMLDLVERTRPGPFWKRTVELGPYLGVRRHGALVAMAGVRLNPPGAREISAVCTAEEVRGQGVGELLVRALCGRIRDAGEVPFLHVVGHNHDALRLYRRLGFTVRKQVRFHGHRVPEQSP